MADHATTDLLAGRTSVPNAAADPPRCRHLPATLGLSVDVCLRTVWSRRRRNPYHPAERRYQLQNDFRSELLQILAGLFVVAGAAATWQQIRIARERQTTERFTKAIEHLGSCKLDIRLGGIYALWTIATQSHVTNSSVLLILLSVIIFLVGLVSEQISSLRFERHQP